MERIVLAGKSPGELHDLLKPFGFPGDTAGKVAYWIYKRGISSFKEMLSVKNDV